jgi:hypothetical protein
LEQQAQDDGTIAGFSTGAGSSSVQLPSSAEVVQLAALVEQLCGHFRQQVRRRASM